MYLNEKQETITAAKNSTLEDLKLRTKTYKNPLYLKFIKNGKLLKESSTLEQLQLVPVPSNANKDDENTFIVLHCFESRPKGVDISGQNRSESRQQTSASATVEPSTTSTPSTPVVTAPINNNTGPIPTQTLLLSTAARLTYLTCHYIIISSKYIFNFIKSQANRIRDRVTIPNNTNSRYLQQFNTHLKKSLKITIKCLHDGILFWVDFITENYPNIILGLGILYSVNILHLYCHASSSLIKSLESGPMSVALSAVSFLSCCFVYLVGAGV